MPLPSELLETIGVTLAIDSLRYPALPLFRYFVRKWLDRSESIISTQNTAINSNNGVQKVILILFESTADLLPSEELQRPGLLGIVDCVTNPLGWEAATAVGSSTGSKTAICSDYSRTSSIVQAVKQIIDSTELDDSSPTTISIAIDSLVPFVIRNGVDAGVNLVNRIMQIKPTNKNSLNITTKDNELGTPTTTTSTSLPNSEDALAIKRVFTIVHEDVVFDTTAIDRLSYFASVVMRTGPPALELLSSAVLSTISKADGEIQILQKRESGKVIRLTEEYTYSGGDNNTQRPSLTFLPRSKRGVGSKRGATSTRTSSSSSSSSSSTPTTLAAGVDAMSLRAVTTTFNLGITEEQKKAKDEVQLPYVHKNKSTTTGSGGSGGSTGGGVIYLDPDDIEYESDDPDDDLDI
eukprot:TRINITY_DN1006_c0_g1_i1.p1 TRINITY_DN1006_c0_g1~~TRINITY_DN1006_c0_g1_i1.p1  ORF type:complete len:433 (-),score=121.07 TRINITY_DN1006_c0_g1_i1:94-1317(-)